MSIVDDHAYFQPDYLANRFACNPLNVSKRAGSPRVFDTNLPYKQEIISAMRSSRSETEILAGMLMLPLPAGPVSSFFSTWVGLNLYLKEISKTQKEDTDAVVLECVQRVMNNKVPGMKTSDVVAEEILDLLDVKLPGFNIKTVISGLYIEAITWYEIIYGTADINI